MIAVEVQHYLNRARDFLSGVDLLRKDLDQYKYSVALLGIHAAISYCDAMRVGLGSRRLSSDDHRAAADDLRLHLGSHIPDARSGTDRLRKILGYKSKIAYGPFESGLDFGTIVKDALRFAAWAENTGRALRIEGWRNE
jgi:hypothetical protein